MVSKRTSEMQLSGIRVFFEMAAEIEDVISLGVGEPDFPTPMHIKYAAIDAINDDFTTYTSNFGMLELREEISKKLKEENNISANPKNEILVTSGGSEIIDCAIRALTDFGDEVIIPEPCYVAYKPCALFGGAKVKNISTNIDTDFRPSIDEINETITKKTKLIIFSTPANPTGTYYDEKFLRDLSDLLLDHQIHVVSDEIYEKLIYDGNKHFSIGSIPELKDLAVTINGFSKAYAMTGWRIGYGTSSKEIVECMMKIHQYMMMCAPSISQRAALEALRGDKSWMDELLNQFNMRRKLIVKGLNDIEGIRCANPHGAFYVFPNIEGTGMTSNEFSEKVLKEGKIVTVPGNVFGDCGEGYVRCTYATDINQIRIALKRIKEVVEK